MCRPKGKGPKDKHEGPDPVAMGTICIVIFQDVIRVLLDKTCALTHNILNNHDLQLYEQFRTAALIVNHQRLCDPKPGDPTSKYDVTGGLPTVNGIRQD